ncbi:MAG: hypothetical protein KDA28_15195, partial [Phycisphaerales bacterium]|nr:hypothetical protein [Phycisphaerales bacterium]
SYDEAFGQEGPWATNFGGPLTDINEFFQTPETLDIAKDRMDQVIAWANQSPFADHILGWEPVSEWDSYEWTLNAEGEAEAGRETEFRRRAQWITELAGHIQQQDPDHLVMSSTIVRDPRGPLARATLHSRNWDMLSPHLYTNSSEEPINNTDADRSVMPAIENGHFGGYWLTSRIDNRPILNGEWGMTRSDWPDELPQYSATYTQAEDEAIYRTVVWSGFASGQAGTGLRIAADELATNGYILTDAMRDTQLTMRSFVDSSSLEVDFSHFAARNLAGRLEVEASGRTVHAWGVSDGEQGIAYLLNDGNVATGLITDGTFTIEGLMRDRLYDVEFWSTGAGVTTPVSTLSGVFAGNGDLTVDLPAFATDLAVKFRARATSTQAQTVVSVESGTSIVAFHLGVDGQPVATVIDASGNESSQDVARLAGFTGRVVDMTPFTTDDGQVHLAMTDESHHVWLISGDAAAGTWSSRDIT